MTKILFGVRLAMLRRKVEVTQESIAKYLGVTPQFVMNWERGASMPPKKYWATLNELYGNGFKVALFKRFRAHVEENLK